MCHNQPHIKVTLKIKNFGFQFDRAFSAATVHDCFNWLAVIVLLIVEVIIQNHTSCIELSSYLDENEL